MKKLFKTIITTMLLVLILVTSAFADSVSDIRNQLISIGIPSNYVANIVEYLQKTTITDYQYRKVMDNIEKAKSIVGNVEDISSLSAKDKSELQELVINSGKILGLNVLFSKNAEGVTVLVITDSNGGVLVELSTLEVIDLVTHFNSENIIKIFENIVEFSRKSEKGTYNPVSGELNKTATSYGNVMALGAILMICASGIFVFSRRKFA